jgi:hypothetical protein
LIASLASLSAIVCCSNAANTCAPTLLMLQLLKPTRAMPLAHSWTL